MRDGALLEPRRFGEGKTHAKYLRGALGLLERSHGGDGQGGRGGGRADAGLEQSQCQR